MHPSRCLGAQQAWLSCTVLETGWLGDCWRRAEPNDSATRSLGPEGAVHGHRRHRQPSWVMPGAVCRLVHTAACPWQDRGLALSPPAQRTAIDVS
jgi:hypothetical protein